MRGGAGRLGPAGGGAGRWGRAGGGNYLGLVVNRLIGRFSRGGSNHPVAPSRANFCSGSRPDGGGGPSGGGIGFIEKTWSPSSGIASFKRVLASVDRAYHSQNEQRTSEFRNLHGIPNTREMEALLMSLSSTIESSESEKPKSFQARLVVPLSSESEAKLLQTIEAWCRRYIEKKICILDTVHASCGDRYQGTVNNEALDCFLRRVCFTPTFSKIVEGQLPIRQHLRNKMAHHVTDWWDPEIVCSHGSIDSVDIPDKTIYDLEAHIEKSGVPLISLDKFSNTGEIECLTQAMIERAVMKIMAYAKPHKKKKSKASDIVLEAKKKKVTVQSHGSSSGNTATVCLDGDWDKCLESYREGIRCLRAWCRDNGTLVDISSLYGDGREMFTTPGCGTFFMNLQYRDRVITLNIYGKDLYVVGWTGGIHGGFELEPDHGSRMCPQGQQMLPFTGSYCMMLEPEYARIGLQSLRDSFEIMYKWDGGQTSLLKGAITVMCVHFSESARLQCVLKTVCDSFFVNDIVTMDSSTKYWVKNYGRHTEKCMKVVSKTLSGSTEPNPIRKPRKTDSKSPDEILTEIRIFNRHGWTTGLFKQQAEDDSPACATREGEFAPPMDLLDDWVSVKKKKED